MALRGRAGMSTLTQCGRDQRQFSLALVSDCGHIAYNPRAVLKIASRSHSCP
jgi:hypothetical protein